MRGLISFALILVFSSLLLQVTQARVEAAKQAYEANSLVLSLEKRYYADLDAKNSFRQVLASAQGVTGEEKIRDAARKLALLENFFENHYSQKGIQIDFWLGEHEQAKLGETRNRMLKEKTVLKPDGSIDLFVHGLDWQGEPVPMSAAVLSYDPVSGKVFVGKNIAVVPEQLFQKPVIGVSIYSNGIAAIGLIQEGFHA